MTSDRAHRTYGIDLLRGIACAAVLLFHYLSRGPRAGWMPGMLDPRLELVARYGYLGVHLFFMVSGYVIFMSAEGRSAREFVASRVARLYPALWVACTLTMLLVVFSGDQRFLVSWSDYAWNLTLVPQYVGARFVDGAYWSLAVELQFYLMVWLVLRTSSMARVELLLWAWLCIAMADALRPMYPAERWLIANWAPLFSLGAVTYLASSRGWTRQRAALAATAGALALWHSVKEAAHLAHEWNGDGPNPFVVALLLCVAAASFVLFGLGTLRVGRTAWATVPGKLTYPVYLVHQFAGYLAYGWLVSETHAPRTTVGIVIMLTVAVGWVIHRGIEQRFAPRLRRAIIGVGERKSA